MEGYADFHLALLRKLHRIICQIHDHLLDPDTVAIKLIGQFRIQIDEKLDILIPDPGGDHRGDIMQDRHGLILFLDDIHLPGFNFREIQNIIDNGQQGLSR